MADYTTYNDAIPGDVIALPTGMGTNQGTPGTGFHVVTFDAARRNLTASDTAVVANFAAGTIIEAVFYEILTVEGSGIGFLLGDATDPNGYVDVADASALGRGFGIGAYLYTLHDTTVNSYTGPKVLTAAQAVKIAPQSGDTLDTLKIRFTFQVTEI